MSCLETHGHRQIVIPLNDEGHRLFFCFVAHFLPLEGPELSVVL